MVPRADLPAAVALNSVGFNLTRSVGPAIGGADRRHRRRRRRLRGQRRELPRADRRALLPGGRTIVRERAAARAARAGHGRGPALRRHVAEPHQGGAARLPLRPDRGRGDGAPAAGGAPPRRGAARSSTARLLGAFGVGRDRRRLHRRPAARRALERVDRAPAPSPASRSAPRCSRSAPAPGSTAVGDAGRRRLLGAGAGALQHHGAALDAALGGGARARALPDRGLRRHGARQLALGQRRRGARRRRRRSSVAAAAMLAAGAVGLRLPLPARAELDLDPLNRWTEPQVGARPHSRAAVRSRSTSST